MKKIKARKIANAFQLVHYSNPSHGGEFVVIVSPGEDPKDHLRDGFEIHSAEEILGWCTSMPCDRELTA